MKKIKFMLIVSMTCNFALLIGNTVGCERSSESSKVAEADSVEAANGVNGVQEVQSVQEVNNAPGYEGYAGPWTRDGTYDPTILRRAPFDCNNSKSCMHVGDSCTHPNQDMVPAHGWLTQRGLECCLKACPAYYDDWGDTCYKGTHPVHSIDKCVPLH